MTFKEENLSDFYQLFKSVRPNIESFPGCINLKAFTDVADNSIIFTYSEWTSEIELNKYRNSELFKSTWSKTKKLFKAPPEAWSMDELSSKDC